MLFPNNNINSYHDDKYNRYIAKPFYTIPFNLDVFSPSSKLFKHLYKLFISNNVITMAHTTGSPITVHEFHSAAGSALEFGTEI